MRPSWPGHAAFALSGLSFLVQDILWLRALATLSCSLAITFNVWHPVGRSLWLPIYWNVGYVVVNVTYICILLSERNVRLSDFEWLVYDTYFRSSIEPHDFQKLARLAHKRVARTRERLMTVDELPSHLYLVYDGMPEIEVSSSMVIHQERGMLGEMSFLRGGVASASVYAPPGTRYLRWDRAELEEIMRRAPSLRRGLELAVAKELMRKLTATNDSFKESTREHGYERHVLHSAIKCAAASTCERADDADEEEHANGGVDTLHAFFDELRRYRRATGIDEQMHASVLARMGLDDEAACRQQRLTFADLCVRITRGYEFEAERAHNVKRPAPGSSSSMVNPASTTSSAAAKSASSPPESSSIVTSLYPSTRKGGAAILSAAPDEHCQSSSS